MSMPYAVADPEWVNGPDERDDDPITWETLAADVKREAHEAALMADNAHHCDTFDEQMESLESARNSLRAALRLADMAIAALEESR